MTPFDPVAIMSTGEIGYDDLMHNDEKTAYCQVGFALLVVFVMIMTVLASNLLIGKEDICESDVVILDFTQTIALAVREIGPMMQKAKRVRLDMLFELTSDIEIIRYGLVHFLTICCITWKTKVYLYEQRNKKKNLKWRVWKALKKQCWEN